MRSKEKTEITWVASTNEIKTDVNKRLQYVFLKQSRYSKEYKFKAIYYSRMYEITYVDTLNYLRVSSLMNIHMKRSLFLKKAKVILNVIIDVKMGLINLIIWEIKEIEENIIHFEYEFKGQKHVVFITRTEKRWYCSVYPCHEMTISN